MNSATVESGAQAQPRAGNSSRLRGRDRFAKQILCFATRPQPVGKAGEPLKSELLRGLPHYWTPEQVQQILATMPGGQP